MKYLVVGIVDASVSKVVEADTPEEAIDRAELSASICYHCARDLSIGDVGDVEVIEDEGAGDVVHSDRVEHEASRDGRTVKVIADWIRKQTHPSSFGGMSMLTLAAAIERGDWKIGGG